MLVIRFAIAWLVLAGVLAVVFGHFNIPTYLRLAEHGRRTIATIIQPDCGNHAEANYTYTVGSTRYSGRDVMWQLNCDKLHPGDGISIYYDATNPNISRAMEPRTGLINELIPILLACLIVPPLMIAGFVAWYRKRGRNITWPRWR
jgi:hypothetical protein